MGMAKCKDCKYYGVCILDRRSADADVTGCKIYEVGERDFVEVVRCKDCKYHHYICPSGFLDRKEDDFCSYGERRAGE